MPKSHYKVDILKFKHTKYTKNVKRITEIQFRQAARAFLRAAIPLVPVQTGMARGSFLNIAKFLNVQLVINPTKFGQKYYAGGTPIAKTKQTGASLTTFSIPGRKSKKKLEFRFNSKVFHYGLEDTLGVRSPSSPWNSMKIGMIAFNEVMSKLTKRSDYPKVADFISTTTIG